MTRENLKLNYIFNPFFIYKNNKYLYLVLNVIIFTICIEQVITNNTFDNIFNFYRIKKLIILIIYTFIFILKCINLDGKSLIVKANIKNGAYLLFLDTYLAIL